MKEEIQHFLLTHLNFLPPELLVIIVSATPILELRGGIPLGLGFGFSFWKTMLLALIGNILPILPALILFQPLSKILLKYRWYKSFYNWLYGRTLKKSTQIQKYGAIGLMLFTAVPLPTTGAYTACIAASIFALPVRISFLAITAGVLIAGFGVGIALYSIF
ncbi:MAG: COG2426 family protein [Desulfitobacteriia bacterium]